MPNNEIVESYEDVGEEMSHGTKTFSEYRKKWLENLELLAQQDNYDLNRIDSYTTKKGQKLIDKAHELTTKQLGYSEQEARNYGR